MIELEKFQGATIRGAAIVGDTLASAIGKAMGVYPALIFNVTTQPAGSDIFSAGSDVAYATAIAATFTTTGRHAFTVGAADAPNLRAFEVVCFPAAALTSDRIRFVEPAKVTSRSDNERRNILRSLAQHATVAGITAALESGTPPAPYNGTSPRTLGASATDSLTPFGASW